ncbi:Uncharacterized protein dnm_049110 [Desulfonema magnum]|uniref:Uncharacterized protein n=1 Tax=Desulfonema magnum TaxID=45655 RepID=A0A975BNB9_9BACT|nr:Uncharacterized protein dnm_049110 [Desulfonema magnum]
MVWICLMNSHWKMAYYDAYKNKKLYTFADLEVQVDKNSI